MKEEYKIHLQEVLNKGSVQAFQNELHNVIKKEIIAMDVPLRYRNGMLDILELIEIPLVIKSYIKYPQKNKKQSNQSILVASATGALLNVLLHKVPFVLKIILSFGGATLVGLLVNGKRDDVKETVLVEKVEAPFEEIISNVDKLLDIIQGVIIPKKIMLSDSFPDILEWYQKAYSSCEEFGTDCSEYFKKRIENILCQNGYILHDFDGTNDNLFRKTEDVEIHTPVQDLPAITNDRDYILPGNLFIPKKSNDLKK